MNEIAEIVVQNQQASISTNDSDLYKKWKDYKMNIHKEIV